MQQIDMLQEEYLECGHRMAVFYANDKFYRQTYGSEQQCRQCMEAVRNHPLGMDRRYDGFDMIANYVTSHAARTYGGHELDEEVEVEFLPTEDLMMFLRDLEIQAEPSGPGVPKSRKGYDQLHDLGRHLLRLNRQVRDVPSPTVSVEFPDIENIVPYCLECEDNIDVSSLAGDETVAQCPQCGVHITVRMGGLYGG